MGGYVNVLAQRATLLEEAITRLASLHEMWTRARVDARASRAPTQVIERIDGVLAAVADTRTRAQARRAATLVSQDSFAQHLAQCETVLARIARIRQQTAGRWLERDSVPLWYPGELARAAAELPAQVRSAISAEIAPLRQFAADQRWKMPLHLALFVGLALVMRAARRRARFWTGAGEGMVLAFDRPFSAALVLALLAVPWIYSQPLPRAVVTLAEVLALPPALRIMRGLLDPTLVPSLYVLGAFFLADLVRHFASVVPLLERQIFLFEMAACVAVLGWWVASRRPRASPAPAPSDRERVLWIAAVWMLAVFAAALVAGVAGYMRLAFLIGGRVLGNGYLALVLYAGVRIGDGLVAFALRARPLRYLGMVQRHRPLLERRGHGLLRWVAIAAGVILALQLFGLWTAAVSLTQTVLAAELRWGAFSISLGDVLAFALTVTVAFLLSSLVRFVLAEDVYPHLQLGRGLPNALSSLLHYCLLTAGFLLALTVLGVDLTKITILAGALGVGIGFGLQSVVNNFVSGALLLFERKINVGDAVQIGDVAGRVQQMGMRACTVRTWEGAEVIVPNASLTADKVTNWTLSDRLRRIDVAVGVAYGTAPDTVQDLMLGVARAHKLVLAEPAPVALFLGFGESALRFEMQVWTSQFERWVQIRSDLNTALYEALRGAGIEIPYPQREVRLRHE
jgi:small-conductance mechanosensitive channel